MKIVVAGATGEAGRGIVSACLADERITDIIIITRRSVAPEVEQHPKVEIIYHKDFSTYPEELMEQLHGAEACLWAIGGRVDQFGGDKDLARKVGVEYTSAAAKAMRDHLTPHIPANSTSKFRFVFCSGMLAEWDQDRTLLFLNDTRKIKGAVEKKLCDLQDEQQDENGRFEAWIARPSYLLSPEAPWWKKMASPLVFGIETTQVGRAMIEMALGKGRERITLTYELQKM